MSFVRILAPVGLACLAIACTGSPSPSSAPSRPPAREIATVRLRDGFVVIHAGGDEKRYDVLDKDGAVISAGLTAAEMQARHPGHFEALERAIVAEAYGAVFDASGP